MPPLEHWPAELLATYFERVAIMHFDGGVDLEVAKSKAMRDVWRSETGGW